MVKNIPIQKNIFKILSRKKVISAESLIEELKNNLKSTYFGKSKIEYIISRTIKKLQSDGMVDCYETERSQYFGLSNSGRKKMNNYAVDGESAIVSLSWDGYWRMIILDLPEERKNEREALRYLLKKAGFYCLKNSVWISMYPFENLFTNIKKDLDLKSEMIIIVTDKIDKETEKEFLEICSQKKE